MGWFRKYFLTNVVIVTVQSGRYCNIHVHLFKDGKFKVPIVRKFFYEKKTKTPEVMLDFIYRYTRTYSSYFSAIVLDSSFQKIVPKAQMTKALHKAIKDESLIIKPSKEWSCYCALTDVELIERQFAQVGFDYICSPYAILTILHDRIKHKHNSIYILALPTCITIMIFKDNCPVSGINLSLVFGLNEGESNQQESLQEATALEDEFDIDSNVDMSEIEIDTDSPSNSFDDFGDEHQLQDSDDQDEMAFIETARSRIVESIVEVAENFYNSTYYQDDNDMIENIIVFNDACMEEDLRTSIGEEMFFEILYKNFDHTKTIAEIILGEAL